MKRKHKPARKSAHRPTLPDNFTGVFTICYPHSRDVTCRTLDELPVEQSETYPPTRIRWACRRCVAGRCSDTGVGVVLPDDMAMRLVWAMVMEDGRTYA